jgi:aminoglycoside phosphotransferase (APT) family kinase protein
VHDTLDELTAEQVFLEFELELEAVEGVAEGLGNRALLTKRFVVRIAKDGFKTLQDHDRECQIARKMLEAGVRTARPVAWSRHYSVFERIPGQTVGRGGTASDAVWHALLDDLERVWANPGEPQRDLEPWVGKVAVLEEPSVLGALTQQEREHIAGMIGQPRVMKNPMFVHGDAFSENVMVHHGEYTAVIDWGMAGWRSLEHEFAALSDRAYALGLERYGHQLDLPFLAALRLNIGLEVAARGFLNWDVVRGLLREARELEI